MKRVIYAILQDMGVAAGYDIVQMSKQKQKGTRVENLVRDKLLEIGLSAERVPLSGALGGKYDGDIVIPSIEHPEFVTEVKARKNNSGFAVIQNWMKDKDMLFIKQNNKEFIVVLPWKIYEKLIKKYYDK